MENYWIALIGIVILLALVAFLLRRRSERKWNVMDSLEQMNKIDTLDATLQRRDEIVRLLRAGQKINAIKLYREETGASLVDAKAAVERIEQRLRQGLAPINVEPVSALEHQEEEPDAWQREVQQLLMQNNKIQAIKLYRERTGLGLKEAKDAVERLEKGQPIDPMLFSSDTEKFSQERPDLTEEIRRQLVMGHKIQAIKLYREQTGASLKDAKDAVEQIELSLNAQQGKTQDRQDWGGNAPF